MAVEQALTKIRAEYKVVLYSLTASVECFILTLPILAFYKMEAADGILVTLISVPSAALVIAMYRRARFLFYLDKTDRFAANSSKNKGRRNQMKQWNVATGRASADFEAEEEAAPRLSDMVNQLDERNDPYLPSHRNRMPQTSGRGQRAGESSLQADAQWAAALPVPVEKTTAARSGAQRQPAMRRSRSFDSAEGDARYSGPSQLDVYGPFPHLAPSRPFDYNYGGQAPQPAQHAQAYVQENYGRNGASHLHKRTTPGQSPSASSLVRGISGLVSGKRSNSPGRVPPGANPNTGAMC